MKKFIVFLVFVFIFYYVYNNRDYIITYVMKNYFDKNKITLGDKNIYYKDFDYSFVQNTDSLEPNNRQDILNIIYTTLNRGLDEVTFYCPYSYENCINDVNDIADNSLYLSSINNLVHPFNSYSNIYFSISNYRKIHITVSRIYTDDYVSFVNNEINNISDSIINSDMSIYDKIKSFHDYIINNTIYDSSVNLTNQLYSSNNSNNAYGLLLNNKAICSGYSDVMAIFLSRLGLNNYRISSDVHIWNLVFFDNSWKHIDVTWDDPVTSNGSNLLLHDFFLIDTDELYKKEEEIFQDDNKDNHRYDKSIYIEAN